MLFRVKACSYVSIALSSNPGMTGDKTYEILIDSKSHIKMNSTFLASKDTPGILKCEEFRPFWISWKNGLIQAGTGNEISTNAFVQWSDPDMFTVYGLAVSTGPGVSGDWDLNLLEGN